ncbi:hypothetical protein DQP57_00195 [Mycobacterium colombiense]|uniref:YprB ribonuclease H-like domain-containing protein n=2 Tax=Mycobacterium colombiense TaxID=339268 RepID=A0A329MD31_9MYCO|nr:hypothetical protein DQP57_00195 [Mycobacterium colombiense]
MIGINQIIESSHIICFAYRWHGEKRTKFASEWGDGYSDMIATLHALFEEADVVCGYNSVGFDDKHTRAAFLTEGLAPPAPFKQLDLYKEIRRQFNFPSRKLDYICQRLGLGHKVAHTGQELWNEVLRPSSEQSGKKARALMAKYCKTDVDLTVDLYDLLYPWLKMPINAGLFVDDNEPACPHCGHAVQRRGWAYTTNGRYRRYYCPDCHVWSKGKTGDKFAELRAA